jgi:hypothetical protein
LPALFKANFLKIVFIYTTFSALNRRQCLKAAYFIRVPPVYNLTEE